MAHKTKGEAMNSNRIPLIALLVIQAAIGYEWAMSGLTKIVRGGFPSGLASELRDKSQGAPSWYRSFLDGSVIPYAATWGYAIEITELAIGVALIATAAIWLFRWESLGATRQQALLLGVAAAALAGIVMNISFHLANGAPHPWLIPKSGFDEGVDLDSLMPFIQLVIAAGALQMWALARRTHAAVLVAKPHTAAEA